MDEHDQASTRGDSPELATEVGERVRTIIAAAEAAANAVRHEAEQEAAVRRRVAEEEAGRIIEDAKADADAYLAERIRRISELSDTLVERAEQIVSRLDRAEEVRQQLQTLADALGESAEKLASEVRIGAPPPTVRSPSTPPGEVPPAPPAQPAADETAVLPPDEPAGVEAPPPDPAAVVPEPAAPAEPPFVEPAEPEGPAAEAAEPTDFVEAEPPPVEEPAPPAPEPDVEAGAETAYARREADQQLGARLVALQMAVAGGNRGEVEVHLRRTFDLEDPSSILDDVFGQGTDADKRVAWPQTGEGAA